ncbi:RHS repeat-associated core domain-containing protein, partial [Myroides sp. TSA_177.3]|uniref:RHS repeat-associated core domain-containing protein n=1 Tax=Myroides sp. TSA_177.3 TaxID=3415650 RepID=UPI0040460B70
ANNQLVNQTVAGDQNCQLYYRAGELVNQVLVEEDKKVRWIKSGATCLAVNDDQDVILTANGQNESLLWSVKNSDSQGELHQYGAYGQGEAEEYLPAYNGERKDPISGHYHLGNGYRSYSPVLMRFTCPDSMSPFGAGGINAYAYCAGDPINLIDPSGHSAMGTAGLFSGGLVTQGLGRLGAGGGIALGIIGIVTAVASMGMSLAAVGAGVAGLSLVLSLASDAVGVASIATAKSNPELSANLGWASFALGLASGTPTSQKRPNVKISSGYTAANQEYSLGTNRSYSNGLWNVEYTIMSPHDDHQSNVLYINAHGRTLIDVEGIDNTFETSKTLHHYTSEGQNLVGSFQHWIMDRADVSHGSVTMPGSRVRNMILGSPYVGVYRDYLVPISPENFMLYRENYNLSAKDSVIYTMKSIDVRMEKFGHMPFHVLMISGDAPIDLRALLESLPENYTEIHIFACRGY